MRALFQHRGQRQREKTASQAEVKQFQHRGQRRSEAGSHQHRGQRHKDEHVETFPASRMELKQSQSL